MSMTDRWDMVWDVLVPFALLGAVAAVVGWLIWGELM
jgi:hypothetical protein